MWQRETLPAFTIKVLQANVGRAYAAHDMAHATAVQMGADILVVGEPNKKRVGGADWITDIRTDVGVLCLNKNLGIGGHTAREGHLVIRFRELNMICCYISPNISMEDYKNETDSITDLCNNQETIILGDINAKSPMWGSPVTDRKGEHWMEWISASDIVVLNTGLKPTFVRGNTESFIDVSMATNKIARQVRNWKVLDAETLTEHKYISFEWTTTKPKNKVGTTKYETDWEAFKVSIELITSDAECTGHEEATKAIKTAYKNCTQARKTSTGIPYWWNDSIAKKRAECNKLRRQQKRVATRNRNNSSVTTEAMTNAYKTCRRELCDLIKAAKKKLWNDLCKDLDNNIWGDAYKIVAKKLKTLKPYELSAEKKTQIAQELFPLGNDNWAIDDKMEQAVPFTEEELESVAAAIKSGKAPGIDRIPPEAIKIVANCAPNWLLRLMNKLLEMQQFPDEWKMAQIVLILKPGKSTELASSYRPLCLLNALSKLLEGLIKNRLQEELEDRGGLHRHQYGFQRGKSTIQAVEAAISTADELNCKFCILVTIDVKNAFNTASHSLIIGKLRERRVSTYLVRFISSYLKDRKIQIEKDTVIDTDAGVPQGSVLGPTLWNILYDDVLDLELTRDAVTIGYADDLALIVGAPDENSLVANTNTCLDKISTWMRSHKLTLAPDKTEAVLIRGMQKRQQITLRLEGVNIRPAKSLKYLGIIIDESLTFGKHIETCTTKAIEKTSHLSRLLPNLGGPACSKRAVLCSALQNIILYGAPIWQDAIKKKKYSAMLHRAQRSMLLRVASAFRTVSGLALQIITASIPIDLLVQERAWIHQEASADKAAAKIEARERSKSAWQERWSRETSKAPWTKRLIPDIGTWANCEHRQLDYHLTQVLTSHGVFRSYAKRFGKDTSDECIYCTEVDTTEHTIFKCTEWKEIRESTFRQLGCTLTPDNLIQKMLKNRRQWNIIQNMVKDIMSRKEAAEYERQRDQA